MTEAENQVWEVVESLNATWTQGKVDELAAHLHEDMVAITPMDRSRLLGRAACAASWERFCKTARILSWKALDPDVRLHGDSAVVTYDYDLTCEVGEREVHLEGRDMFFLVRQDGRWWPVANQFSSRPAQDGGVA